MKNLISAILTVLLLTISFNTMADEEATNENENQIRCTPAPRCEQDGYATTDTFTIKKLVDQLTIQQLLELLKSQQEQSEEVVTTHNE